MINKEPPKIEFPCEYPIKVMGEASALFHQHVLGTMDKYAAGFDRSKVSVRDSKKGRWHSITITITATGYSQLEDIFKELKSNSSVKMVI